MSLECVSTEILGLVNPVTPSRLPTRWLDLFGGDVIGDYSFPQPLEVGGRLVFLDMAHYTMVKNNHLHGVRLPSIAIIDADRRIRLVREFGYQDYSCRLHDTGIIQLSLLAIHRHMGTSKKRVDDDSQATRSASQGRDAHGLRGMSSSLSSL